MKTTNEQNVKNKNRGITLIALIITIIVMLILVAVTVTMAVNGGLFEKAASAGRQTNEERDRELEIAKGETIQDLINKYTTSTGVDSDDEDDEEWPESPYIGCYADLDGNGEIETDKDGIIYADLGVGNTRGGQWRDENGAYTIPVETNLKEYEISDTRVDGPFGERKVVTLIEEDETKNERFYVMALEDFTTDEYEEFDWDSNYNGIEFGTSGDFGKGKENTYKLITTDKVTWTNQDIWKNLSANSRWFVPSRAEWSAFAQELGITSYNSNYGLSFDYWSSSLIQPYQGWMACFSDVYLGISYEGVDSGYCFRLSTIF